MGRKLKEHPFYTVIYVSFLFFIVIPVAWTFSAVLFTGNSFTGNLQFLNKGLFLLLAKSCIIAFPIAVLSTSFGTALGFLLYKTKVPFRNFFKIVLLIPLFISPYILAVAWKDFFFLTFGNADLISSYIGVILVLTTIFTPLSMLITGSALSNINSQLEETGFLMTGFSNVIIKITFPLIKPALITSFVLVFIFSISEFSVPAFFGVKIFTTEIFTQFSAFYNHSLAILQSALLILLCIILLLAERKHIADAPFLSVSSKGSSIKFYDLIKRRWVGVLSLLVWLFFSIFLPFIVLFIQSFQNGTASFIKAFELLKPTFGNSVGLAFSGALIVVLIGIIAALGQYRKRKSFNWFLLLLFATPSTIIGISLIKFYNHPILDFIYSGFAIILIGYAGKFSFISAKLIGNAMKQIPNSLDEAAQIEGITFFKRLREILIPLIMPTLLAAFIISFLFCLGELGITIMLYPPGTEIMPIKVFSIMGNATQSLTSSLTLIVFSFTLLIIAGLYFIVKIFLKNYTHVNH
jgi:ABC-type Fe3+ transport system permease subunit